MLRRRSLADDTPAVITGVGLISPIGFGRQQFWSALCEGRSGIRPIEGWSVQPGRPRLAAQVRDFAAREFITSSHLRRMDRLSRMIVAASRMALDDGRLSLNRLSPDRLGVVVGSAFGNISESVRYLERVFAKGPAAASPMVFPTLVLNAPASYVAMELGVTGINFTVSQNETTGQQAIILAHDMVRAGRADVVLAGGGDEFAPIVHEVAYRARALSSQHGGREWSSPYDIGRNGIVFGEGAAMLVVESARHARARGAAVLAAIEQVANFTVPAPPYGWPATARAALPHLRRLLGVNGDAGTCVDLVCGAANSSRRLDACELDLFAALFEQQREAVMLTSIKGAIGEFGAADALTAAAAVLALCHQSAPPLCHLTQPEQAPPLRFAGTRAKTQHLDHVLVSGIARGGGAAALLLARGDY